MTSPAVDKTRSDRISSLLNGMTLLEALKVPALANLFSTVREFKFNAINGNAAKSHDARYWDISVVWRGEDSWAVENLSEQWNFKQNKWDYELQPSSRTKKYIRECRTDLPKAIQKALELSEVITVNGKNVEQFVAWWNEKEAEKD
jgi:hypothetical protein